MSITLLSFMLAIGAAGVVYSKFGPRLGYGNQQNVWLVTGIGFVFTFVVVYTFTKYVLGLE